jgi:hypothetical protein
VLSTPKRVTMVTDTKTPVDKVKLVNISALDADLVLDLEESHDLPNEIRSLYGSPTCLVLTERLVEMHLPKVADKQQRVITWLLECTEHTCATTLPAYLPDIGHTNRSFAMSPI